MMTRMSTLSVTAGYLDVGRRQPWKAVLKGMCEPLAFHRWMPHDAAL
jgi:hypothetical protein